jgi:type VI protein secretion system component VasK
MSIEGTPEPYLPTANAIEQRPSRKGFWVRIVVYLVLASALGFAVWRIYTNHKQAAANSASQAAALLSRPVPVQVAAAEAHAHLPVRAGHSDTLHERHGEGAGLGRT